jgi:hypothetical protein
MQLRVLLAEVGMSSIPSLQPIASMRISSHNYALRQLSNIPPGAPPPPDIPNPLNYPDADTQVTQRAKPIRVFTDFYLSKYGFEFPSFREFVLMHQGLHHYTGWYDFPTLELATSRRSFTVQSIETTVILLGLTD